MKTQREIKFRAWDINRKLYIEEPFGVDCKGGFIYFEPSSIYITPKIVGVDIVLEQYINLKDKNGKEIYENDFVNYDTGRDFETRKNLLVEWDLQSTGYLPFIDFNGFGEYIFESNPSMWEVVGNRYENPELLEGGEK